MWWVGNKNAVMDCSQWTDSTNLFSFYRIVDNYYFQLIETNKDEDKVSIINRPCVHKIGHVCINQVMCALTRSCEHKIGHVTILKSTEGTAWGFFFFHLYFFFFHLYIFFFSFEEFCAKGLNAYYLLLEKTLFPLLLKLQQK